jgi:hypothetical protein
MPGYNLQRQGTARTSQLPFSVLCVQFVCKCVMSCCHRVSTQLQLNIYHIISYIILPTLSFTGIQHHFHVTDKVPMFWRNLLPISSDKKCLIHWLGQDVPLKHWYWCHNPVECNKNLHRLLRLLETWKGLIFQGLLDGLKGLYEWSVFYWRGSVRRASRELLYWGPRNIC